MKRKIPFPEWIELFSVELNSIYTQYFSDFVLWGYGSFEPDRCTNGKNNSSLLCEREQCVNHIILIAVIFAGSVMRKIIISDTLWTTIINAYQPICAMCFRYNGFFVRSELILSRTQFLPTYCVIFIDMDATEFGGAIHQRSIDSISTVSK